MRAVRAIAVTVALVAVLMGTLTSGAMAAGGKAKGSITVPGQGTLSFHASEPAGGGAEITGSPYGNLVGNVICYVQGPTVNNTTNAVFVERITKGPRNGQTFTVYLEDAPTGDTFSVVSGGSSTCPAPADLPNPQPGANTGYIDIR